MCGIYGSTIYYDDDMVRAKLARAGFRGPDFSSFKRAGKVILGHNRLAIVDLDSRSNQPLSYLHLKVVFNGEIYNYRSLRAKLQAAGYFFFTDSDTEVIAAAYVEYGPRCVHYLNGMFAFVIYDAEERKLFGARDRLGKKPFYYAHNGLNFEFASQPSQIAIGNKTTVDERSMVKYLIWGYIPEPDSAWLEIKKLQAGHSFCFDIDTGRLTVEKYWDMDILSANPFNGSYKHAKGLLRDLLAGAVKLRLHADVSLGIFLSGGIDSSLIAALAARSLPNVKTFCVRFNEKGFDESLFAEKVARHLQTEHHVIECNPLEGISMIGKFGEFYDEPFADASAIPSLLLNKYTKPHATVALTGDGGDESFMGYTRYKWFNMANTFFKLPLPIRTVMSNLLKLSPDYRHKLIAAGISMNSIPVLYAEMLGGLDYSWMENPEDGLQVPFMEILSAKNGSLLKKMSAFDIKTYLNGDINTKVDRASMAFAVETRSPLMDHRVVSFAQTLPDHYKYYFGQQKRILKDILFDYVPAALFNRPKSGFSMPFRHWFRNEMKDYVLDQLSPQELKNIPGINVQKTLKMIDEHMAGKWNRYPQIWKLLVLVQWYQNQKVTQSEFASQAIAL